MVRYNPRMKVYFARHGQTPASREGFLADTHATLTDDGREEAWCAATALTKLLGGESLAKIIASPRQRTLETASIIARRLGIAEAHIATDERLAERDCTPFFGHAVADVFAQSEADLVRAGMEPLTSVQTRTETLWNELTHQPATGAVLLVGHNGNVGPLWHAAHPADQNVPIIAAHHVLRLQ